MIRALSPQQEGLERNLAFFDQTFLYNSFGRQEAVEQLVTAATRIRGSEVDLEMQTKFFERARTEMEQLNEDQPNDARLRLFIASFLNRFGFYDDAIVQLEKALELSPGKQVIHFELGTAYINKGETDKAFEVFETAYNLEPNFRDARFIYATGALYAGRVEVADEIMDTMFKEFDEGKGGLRIDDRVIRGYVAIGRLDRIISIWERAIERVPDNPDYHLSLGAAYAQTGEREKAIAEIERVIELNPDFKEQGDFYIQEIRAGRNP